MQHARLAARRSRVLCTVGARRRLRFASPLNGALVTLPISTTFTGMTPFTTGVCAGVGASLLLAIAGGAFAYRRFILLERRARHAERLAELGTLTGGLAHEIKNPLSTVQLNLQLLQEDLPPGDSAYSRIVSRLNTVQRETSRLRDILDDFL